MADPLFPWRHGVGVLAHRGGAGPWRENTVEAFAGALVAGADGVELDVRRTMDGALVVHHDAAVEGSGPIHDRRRDELPGWVPTLAEALAVCDGAAVNVEIKNVPTDAGFDQGSRVSADVAGLLGVGDVARSGWPAWVVVSSFWPDTLGALRAATERLGSAEVPALGLLVHPALDAGPALDTAVALGCAALHPHHRQVDGDLVAKAHDLGLAVVTWTVNETEDLDAVVGAEVDAVITDRVGETLAHLR
ncbi:MAG TPA: glycerophosphodiester phosphodiesterase [Acidimicrobiales bacterium]|nr:glycerophosphodiester phosphodiesterase [Acidimicrobiales bacterium]